MALMFPIFARGKIWCWTFWNRYLIFWCVKSLEVKIEWNLFWEKKSFLSNFMSTYEDGIYLEKIKTLSKKNESKCLLKTKGQPRGKIRI